MSKIYLNDESNKVFKSIVKNEVELIKADSKNFFNLIGAIYTKTGSENLHKCLSTINSFYSGDFKNKVNKVIKKWEDNNASIVAVLKKESEDSSSHISLAKNVQKDLIEIMKELFKSDFEIPRDVAILCQDEEKVWEEVKDVIVKYNNGLENKKSIFVAKSVKMSDENQLFLCIKAMVEPIYEAYLDLSNEICKGFNKKKEDVLSKSKKASGAVVQENAGLNKQGKSAAEMFKDEFKMLLGDRYKSTNGREPSIALKGNHFHDNDVNSEKMIQHEYKAEDFYKEFTDNCIGEYKGGLFGNLGPDSMTPDYKKKVIIDYFKKNVGMDLHEWCGYENENPTGKDEDLDFSVKDYKYVDGKKLQEVSFGCKDRERWGSVSRITMRFDVSSGYFCLYDIRNPKTMKYEAIEPYCKYHGQKDILSDNSKSLQEIKNEYYGIKPEPPSGKFHIE